MNLYNDFDFTQCLHRIDSNPSSVSLELHKTCWSIDLEFNISVSTELHKYKANLVHDNFTDKKIALVVCVKGNPKLLEFCLKNLRQSEIIEYCDILVVDDRPASSENLDVCESQPFECSYLSIHNDADIFNYSNLNNIAATYCKNKGKENVIFWNSDMWPENNQTLPSVLDKHQASNSTVTGIRLVYPEKEKYQEIFGSYKHVLGRHIENCYNTIQHAGIIFVPSNSLLKQNHLTYLPFHQWRFWKPDYYMANEDILTTAVTGALHIISVDDFIELNGYSMSLASSFQDIDLCQRVRQKNRKVLYVGSEFMFHAETITNNAEGNLKKPTMVSDRILYEYMWWNDPRVLRDILGIERLS